MKKAIIVGSSGQDGKILYQFLVNKGYVVVGINKEKNESNIKDIPYKTNILDTKEVFELIKKFKPTEIYHLAAMHHSSEDHIPENIELFEKSYQINVLSLLNFLEGVRKYSKKTKLFYASSSHVFGTTKNQIQKEDTPINPDSIYGITKANGIFICNFYRKEYLIHASSGILYNHESEFRNKKFLSKKIILGAINIKQKKQDKLIIGDLSAKVDWGYAYDYVDAMHKILLLDYSDNFIIATGEKHSVKEFVEETFNLLGLDWKKYVKENKAIIKKRNNILIGNSSKLRKETGWKPTVTFKEMIKKLLEKEMLLEKK